MSIYHQCELDGIRILNQPRGTGKTTYLVYASSILKQPIIVPNRLVKEELIRRAEQLHIPIPEPMVLSWKLRGHDLKEQKVLVDEYPQFNQVLQDMLNQMGIKINDDSNWVYNEELQLVRGLAVFGLRPSIITCTKNEDKQIAL